jgi:hypothetical protein
LIPDVARGRELLALVKAGAIDGLSIGYRTVTSRIDPKTRVRKLHQVDLWEISIVTFPLLAGARVHAAKAASSRPKPSPARRRAEVAWDAIGKGDPPGGLCSQPAAKSAARSHDAQCAFGVRPTREAVRRGLGLGR